MLQKNIKELEKEIEKSKEIEDIKRMLEAMETKIERHEKDVQDRKARKFTRDRIDYETGRVYTFARRFDHMYQRLKTDTRFTIAPIVETDFSSDISSADEGTPIPQKERNKEANEDPFLEEVRVYQMCTRQRGRGRGTQEYQGDRGMRASRGNRGDPRERRGGGNKRS